MFLFYVLTFFKKGDVIQGGTLFNRPNSVERSLASTPKMEYQFFLCIFQKNSAMATYGLKEVGKFLWEGREKGV